jgi:hypothetical protein
VKKTTIHQGSKTVAAAGTAEALVATSRLVRSVEFIGYKARQTANTGAVYVGNKSAQLRTIASASSLTITAIDGERLDLTDIYIDAATNGDGVLFTYRQ